MKHFPFRIFATSLVVTFFATSGFIFSSAFTSFQSMEQGQKLGITTSSSMYTLQYTEEARKAFYMFCNTYPNDCSLDIFCKKYSNYCALRPTTDTSTIYTVTNDSTSFTDTSDTSVKLPSATPQPSYTLVPQKIDSARSIVYPTSQPSPTTSVSSPTPLPRLVDTSYCYDSDGNDATANGTCRDQSGIYYDSCANGVVSEYVCRSTKCVALESQCKLGTSCLINRCVELPPSPTSQSTTEQAVTQAPQTTRTVVQNTPIPSMTKIPAQQHISAIPTVYEKPQDQVIVSPVQKEMEAPVIVSPANGLRVSGNVIVQVSAQDSVFTTLLLQPISNSSNRIAIGKVGQDGKMIWDTTLVPNGDYNLYAVSHGVIRKYVGEPVSVAVSNVAATNQPQLILSSEFKPEEVPVKQSITIEKVEPYHEKSSSAVQFSGVAEPNQIITILIYSNPIVVTVRADVNGVWTYTLDEPLEPGDHEAYVVVPQADGTQVRSELSIFSVPEVYASSFDNQALTTASATKSSMMFNFILLAVILVLDAVVVLLLVYRFKMKRLRHV